MEKQFQPKNFEKKWQDFIIQNKVFKSQVNEKESYTVLIPPPNVTGVLHFGHVLNNCLQDFFIRKAKKEGYNVNWVPGTDHAAIATEAKVVGYLREKGIKKSDLTREEFINYCWEWKDKYGGIIVEQLKSIGVGCDWDRLTFTLDDHYYKAVIRVFVDLHRKGYIYKGKRIINWDCEAKTALSNEEVYYNEGGEKSKLYYINYKMESGDGFMTIATTRPETIFADTAIAVNPDDPRYRDFLGKYVLIPLINKRIPIIADKYVDSTFGTGGLKVTPAHDINDYEIGQRHGLEVIDILNDDGTLNELSNYPEFVGLDRFEVRKRIERNLEAVGALNKVEEIENKVARSERTGSIVEPKLSMQWWISMKDLSQKAYEVVMNDEVAFYPTYHKNTFNHWMTNIRDWCISRQLWWGHRIPAYYLPNGEYVVAETQEEALKLAQAIDANLTLSDLKQDEDVLDTWASSWLWPMEVFYGFDNQYFNQEKGKIEAPSDSELSYYIPSKILVTAPEIMFLWVTRMIIANYEYTDKKPFDKVFFTGTVRDKLGRKMSKSLGNSPDIHEMAEKYSMDGIRFSMMSLSPAGNDIIFEEKSLEVGRNFCNKLWNASRLIKGWEVQEGTNPDNAPIIEWFEQLLKLKTEAYFNQIEDLRISEALKELYSFVWNDFCSWYLEMIKPEMGQPMDKTTYDKTLSFTRAILSMLNPVMPFITEELWGIFEFSKDGFCFDAPFEKLDIQKTDRIKPQLITSDLIVKVRDMRNQLQLKNKDVIQLSMDSALQGLIEDYFPKIKKTLNVDVIDNQIDAESTSRVLVDNYTVIIHSENEMDATKTIEKIKEEINYISGFIQSIDKKLSNEKFVNNAPPSVVELERKKMEDGKSKLEQLQINLQSLTNN